MLTTLLVMQLGSDQSAVLSRTMSIFAFACAQSGHITHQMIEAVDKLGVLRLLLGAILPWPCQDLRVSCGEVRRGCAEERLEVGRRHKILVGLPFEWTVTRSHLRSIDKNGAG